MSAARRAPIVAALLALAALALTAAPAAAEFGPLKLISTTVPQQAQIAKNPVLSADGRYIAFEGIMDGGQTGIFRADVQTGVVERVATRSAVEFNGETPPFNAPSISAEGRFVSFTTAIALDPADDPTPGSSDVYVADMAATPPTYELASAVDGGSEALSTPATAAPRVALSGNGRAVAFVSGGQVYLRNLDSKTTTLVSVARDPLTGAMEPGTPVPGGAVMERSKFSAGGGADPFGASISADGTTVAWLGAHLPAQVPMLAAEKAEAEKEDVNGKAPYDEPLWRRVADGPLAPTRRIIGGGDPLAPGCPGTSGTLAEPACQGPFTNLFDISQQAPASGWLRVSETDGVPQLSADGQMALVIGSPTEATNVFLVNMAPGLSRVQAMHQLTRQVPVKAFEEAEFVHEEANLPYAGPIFDAAISPDGERIAFVTSRQFFPLAPPNLDTPRPTQIGFDELYVIDLENGSLRRVTHGTGGITEPSLAPEGGHPINTEYGASSPSFGAGGTVVGFASGASNLIAGDGNRNPDVFTVEDLPTAPRPPAADSTAATKKKVSAKRRLRLSAFSLPSGKVKLVATAPLIGRLRARATAVLHLGKPAGKVAADGAKTRPNVPVKLILALPRRLRHLAHSKEGLFATVVVRLRPKRGKILTTKLQVRFHAHPAKAKPKGAK